MKQFAAAALETARLRGATYADVRVIHQRRQALMVKNGRLVEIEESESTGCGVRAIAGGAWGFAAGREMSLEAVQATAACAVAVARASALVSRHPVSLAAEEPRTASYRTPVRIEPFDIPLSRKIDLLLRVDGALRAVKGVTVAESSLAFREENKLFASSEGSLIEQSLVLSGGGCVATAVRDGEVQVRSYPAPFGGQWACCGYELFDEFPLLRHAPRIAEEAVALLDAPQCPSGTFDLILGSSQLALQVHESCGHPIELDRVLGSEANFAGTSFLTPGRRGRLRYGSPIVNVVADATAEHGPGPGTFGFDDEGVPAQRSDIVREGTFVGYLMSRETALQIGERASNGTMRAEGWANLPLIRMTNVSVLPGEQPLTREELIAGTRRGIYMEDNRSWSIDDRRLNFQFGTEIGWEIEDGRIVRMVKNPTYGGTTPEFWNSCDAICDRREWTLWGVPNCGKGEPIQIAATGHGASPARFRSVRVGVGYAG